MSFWGTPSASSQRGLGRTLLTHLMTRPDAARKLQVLKQELEDVANLEFAFAERDVKVPIPSMQLNN
ncbi:hypothetical protein EON64_11215 [archaeon]|nr:MAG: hypothetical protein EON64_11215 [archaeon]